MGSDLLAVSSDCNLVDNSSRGNIEVLGIDIEAVLSLETALRSLTDSDENSCGWASRRKRLRTASKTSRQVRFSENKRLEETTKPFWTL